MAVQWGVYFVRLWLSYLYGLFVFISKPGSVLIVPIAFGVLLTMTRDATHPYLEAFIEGFMGKSWVERQADLMVDGYIVDPMWLDLILLGLWIAFLLFYRLLSPATALMIQTFPRMTRPLPPVRKIVAKPKPISSEVVRIAVPPLRR